MDITRGLGSSGGKSRRGESMTILTVDDSRTFQAAMADILNEIGYTEVVQKASATEALHYLHTVGDDTDGPGVDVIIMDLVMPGMDGIEGVRAIKRVERLKDIPIVMLSALDEEKKIEEAFVAGAADFIGKPVKKLELQARLRSVLKLKSEMDIRKARERELEKMVEELRKSIAEVNTLNGLLPICAFCKKIRDDRGYWQQVESYVTQRSRASFSHSVCPECLRHHYPKQAERILQEDEKPGV
jgi:CheY-like chemotaxis protein